MNKDRLLDELYNKTVSEINERWPHSQPLSKLQISYIQSLLAGTITKTASIVAGEVAGAYEGLLDSMGLGIDNFKKSDWDYVQEIKSRYGVE